MNLKKIQVTPVLINKRISLEDVTPSDTGVLNPIAPLITVTALEDESRNTNLFFRMVVFIDSKNEKAPTFGVDTDENSEFYVSFSLASQIPKEYSAWYIEALYPVNLPIGPITVYTQNDDPRTSRGTVTTVIIETPLKETSGY